MPMSPDKGSTVGVDRVGTALGVLRYGLEYFAAAEATDDAIGDDTGHEIHAPMVVNFLVGQAIELALKAFLYYRGIEFEELRNTKRFGHDLVALFAEARKRGFDNGKWCQHNDPPLGVLNQYYKARELQYFKAGIKEGFPVYGPLCKLAVEILSSAVEGIPGGAALRQRKATAAIEKFPLRRENPVLIRTEIGFGRVTLSRPDALHALNTQMCRAMIEALMAWRDDASVKAILIEHAPGTRGFCAGGDIRMLAESGKSDGREAREFFYAEYQLNHLLFTYNKPVIAIMDGVTMGGGVGISMPARFRIATENTTYAMPETGIGLFPDVGGGWYLPRKPNGQIGQSEIGTWLALTGARLKAADCLIAGVATHYLSTEMLGPARAQIAGAAQTHDAERALSSGLDALSESAGKPKELTPENIERINRIFAADSVEAIIAALEVDGSDWAKAQFATLATKSPQTLKVSFRQLREGARMSSFADEMVQEYRIACRVAQRHDFIEGVRALIVDKDNKPAWNPPALAGVTDAMLDEIFAVLPADEEWTPL